MFDCFTARLYSIFVKILNFFKLKLLALLLDHFWLCHLDRIPIVETIIFSLQIDFIGAFTWLLHVKIDLYLSTLNVFTVHFLQCVFSWFMRLEINVGEAFGHLGLPVVAKTNRFNFTVSPESIANIVLLKRIWKSFHKKSFAVRWHRLYCLSYKQRECHM